MTQEMSCAGRAHLWSWTPAASPPPCTPCPEAVFKTLSWSPQLAQCSLPPESRIRPIRCGLAQTSGQTPPTPQINQNLIDGMAGNKKAAKKRPAGGQEEGAPAEPQQQGEPQQQDPVDELHTLEGKRKDIGTQLHEVERRVSDGQCLTRTAQLAPSMDRDAGCWPHSPPVHRPLPPADIRPRDQVPGELQPAGQRLERCHAALTPTAGCACGPPAGGPRPRQPPCDALARTRPLAGMQGTMPC